MASNELCCGGAFTLRGGTIVLAIANIIGDSVGILYSSYFMVLLHTDPDRFKLPQNATESNNDTAPGTVTTTSKPPDEGLSIPDLRQFNEHFFAFFLFAILFSAVQLVFSILLLQGALQRSASKCRPWYVVNCCLLRVTIVGCILLGGYILINNFLLVLIYALVCPIPLGLITYWFWVVGTFMEEIEQQQGNRTYAAVNEEDKL